MTKRFSLSYLGGGSPTKDSTRFRTRLATYMGILFEGKTPLVKVAKDLLEMELGVSLSGYYVVDIKALFERGELRDVLDAITLIHQVLAGPINKAREWKGFVERVLKEENMGYVLDDGCGVHYLVDEQFQATRASILKVLEEPRYGGVRAAFEDAYKHFDRDDTKAAVRSMYEALEILAKLLKPGSPRLTKELVNDLRKQYSNRYDPKDEAARTAYNALFDAMVPFAVGLHVYRHGQAAQTAIAPDEITSVNVLNTGAAHIRWLIDLDIKAPLTST